MSGTPLSQPVMSGNISVVLFGIIIFQMLMFDTDNFQQYFKRGKYGKISELQG